MNAAGFGAEVVIDGQSYYFESAQAVTQKKVEKSELVGGGCYREAAGAAVLSVEMKARIKPSQMGGYLRLMQILIYGRHSIEVNDMTFTGMALVSGRVGIDEGMDFAFAELVFEQTDG